MRKRIFIPVLFGVLLTSLGGHAQTLNYKIATLFVYNFTKYIEWPTVKSDEFVIGVYGNSPLTDELKKFIVGKHVGEKTIVVEKVMTMEEAAACQIVFVPLSESSSIKKMSDMFKGRPILIVSEKEGLEKKGASISIFLDEDDDYKTKFDLNQTYIKFSGLFISQRLVSLASSVH